MLHSSLHVFTSASSSASDIMLLPMAPEAANCPLVSAVEAAKEIERFIPDRRYNIVVREQCVTVDTRLIHFLGSPLRKFFGYGGPPPVPLLTSRKEVRRDESRQFPPEVLPAPHRASSLVLQSRQIPCDTPPAPFMVPRYLEHHAQTTTPVC
jgi:hypothetical protein